MPAFRVQLPDGTESVVELEDLIERLHRNTNKADTMIALICEHAVVVRLKGNIVATVSLYHDAQETLQLAIPEPAKHYAARVGFTFHAETDVYIHDADSKDEAKEIVDRWLGGDPDATKRVWMEPMQLIEGLRDSVDRMERQAYFGGSDAEVIEVVESPLPTRRQLT